MRRQHLHPWWTQRPVLRNADTRMRELEHKTVTGEAMVSETEARAWIESVLNGSWRP